MSTKNSTSDEFAAGEEALENAAELIAKAAQADDLDADFGEYDEAAAASAEDEDEDEDEEEEGAEESVPAETGAPPPLDEDRMSLSEDLEDEDAEEEDEEEPMPEREGVIAKADEVEATMTVDALPILKALDERLERFEAKFAAMVGIAKAHQAVLGHFAKAQDALAGAPRKPKSATVSVPSGKKPNDDPDINSLYAKAAEVVDDPHRFGIVEHHYNRKDTEGMLAAMTAEQRAKVLAPNP